MSIQRVTRGTLVTAMLSMMLAADARAEGAGGDAALAETLFQTGRQLMTEGKHAEACPKLAESHRLDPAGGTVLMVGLCYEASHRWASAWVALNEALGLARKDAREDREKRAKEHLAIVEAKMSRLTVKLSPKLRATKGLTLRRDGRELPEAAWDTPIPLDPGDHKLEAGAPGYEPWSAPFIVREERGDVTLDVPELAPSRAVAAAPSAAAPAASTSAAPAPSQTETPPVSQPHHRVAAFSLGAVGVVALGVGSYFGLRAMSLASDANDSCPTSTCSDRAAVADSESAERAARIANVGVALGALALGGAAALYFTGDRAGSAKPATRGVALAPSLTVPIAAGSGATLSLGGRW